MAKSLCIFLSLDMNTDLVLKRANGSTHDPLLLSLDMCTDLALKEKKLFFEGIFKGLLCFLQRLDLIVARLLAILVRGITIDAGRLQIFEIFLHSLKLFEHLYFRLLPSLHLTDKESTFIRLHLNAPLLCFLVRLRL